ncbi:class I SAM-dependent methyltransferase [Mycolicibacterium sp. GF69]|uniref:class I SAM-dependent methyltransferase n=1 Tax=Mycolicibacterium sp. GF69 TaxID=2267251 RepID=UPI001F0B7DEA|nr:class I SAM-dependent methyltransferase [Mycolicibacterium sp. GF69]
MDYMAKTSADIDRMPRGGPDASCLDRLLETDRPEYLDRDSDDPADAARKRSVIRALEFTGELFGSTERFAEIALAEIEDVADPEILELGAGHGGLSRKLLDWHPTARLTVTDVDEAAVAAMAAGDLGHDPRATVRRMDATRIDAPDSSFDLAVFAQSFHHLPPSQAARVFAEGTRVAHRLVIIDLPRPPSPIHLARLASMLPFAPLLPFAHDGVISSLRTYSPSALRALAAYADPAIEIDLRGGPLSPQIVVARRGGADASRSGDQR